MKGNMKSKSGGGKWQKKENQEEEKRGNGQRKGKEGQCTWETVQQVVIERKRWIGYKKEGEKEGRGKKGRTENGKAEENKNNWTWVEKRKG